jgi:hypothetical protein
MTNGLVTPPSAAAPLQHRYLPGNAHAHPTATLSTGFERKNADRSARQHPPLGAKTGHDHPRATHSPGFLPESEEADLEPRIKSP